MLTTGHQLRAARSLIGWEQTDVASASGLSVNTIRSMESSGNDAIAGRSANVQRVQRALEDSGIEFLNHGHPGVRLRPFRPGDAVRLRKGSSVWGQYTHLSDRTGVVVELVDDGTAMRRVTVSYDGKKEFMGIDANLFEYAK